MVDETPAATLLAKLSAFTRALDPGERRLFVALIGPGIELAIGGPDVEGFSGGQESDRLVRALAALARRDQPADGSGTEPADAGSDAGAGVGAGAGADE